MDQIIVSSEVHLQQTSMTTSFLKSLTLLHLTSPSLLVESPHHLLGMHIRQISGITHPGTTVTQSVTNPCGQAGTQKAPVCVRNCFIWIREGCGNHKSLHLFGYFFSLASNDELSSWDTGNILEFDIKPSYFQEYTEVGSPQYAGILLSTTLVISP